MEQVITIAIYIHAFLGGVGLISGLGSMIFKKGSIPHKKMGKLFSISMLGSCLISLVVACMPNHENLFLFLIGVFTIYLVLAGNIALTFKSKQKATRTDFLISGSMFIFSILMVLIGLYGILNAVNNSILYLFFGSFGLLMTNKDFKLFRSKDKKQWLANHVGKMVGAFIASVTAFIVAGLGLGNSISWILPSLLGTIYITFWINKLKANKN